MMTLDFIPIQEFIQQYNTNNSQVPRLFVWESFEFCDCENKCISHDFVGSWLETLEECVDRIAVRSRKLKQRDYNNEACYYVNDYYFTLKGNPDDIFVLCTNILLSEWIIDKWHRGIEQVASRLLSLADSTRKPFDADIVHCYVISDDYDVSESSEDEDENERDASVADYYDESTLRFPYMIETATETTNPIAREVANVLGFRWPVPIISGK